MTAAVPSNQTRPAHVELPEDVGDIFRELSTGYENRDLNRVMDCVSDDFLHQGMDKEIFRRGLAHSYLLKNIDWMKISIIRLESKGNTAEFAGIAESNLGVLPAAENLLPLIEGSRLIRENDGWKLLGNQSPTTMGLYRAFHQLSAYFVPENLVLYRSLLPSPLKVPGEPLVFVNATDFTQTRLPLPTHKKAHVQILAQHKNIQGWYTLSMPEDAYLPVEMGKTLGYPKYVADSVSIERWNGGWAAEVKNESNPSLALSLHFVEDRSQASWFETITRSHPMILIRKLLPNHKEKSWFLRMPLVGEEAHKEFLLLKGEPKFTGLPKIKENFGRIQMTLNSDQPWAALFPQEITAKGVFMNFKGELILRHKLID